MKTNSSFAFNKRYFVIGVLIFIIAVYIGINLNGIAKIDRSVFLIYSLFFVTFIAIPSFVVRCIFPKHKKLISFISAVSLSVIIFIIGFARAYFVTSNFEYKRQLICQQSEIHGVIKSEADISSSGKSYCFTADIYNLSSKPIKVIIYTPVQNFDDTPTFGKSFKCKTAFIIESKPSFDGAFDFNRYLLQKEIVSALYSSNLEYTDNVYKKSLFYHLEDVGMTLRTYIQRACDLQLYGENEKALLKGILVGDISGFSDSLYSDYTSSGFIHIASVSGMHVSYLFLLLSFLLIPIRIPKRFKQLITIPILIIFLSIALFTPSACRAVIMMTVLLLAPLFGRKNDSITALSFAALILIFQNPYCLESYSFLLSFGATLGILIFTPLILARLNSFITDKKKLNPFLLRAYRYVSNSVSLSIAGTIGIAYFTARFFGRITWGGIIGNIIIFPCVAAAFILGYLNCGLYYLSLPLSSIIGKFLLNPILRFINFTADIFSNKFFSIQTPYPPKSFFIIYLVICCTLYVLLKKYDTKKDG